MFNSEASIVLNTGKFYHDFLGFDETYDGLLFAGLHCTCPAHMSTVQI